MLKYAKIRLTMLCLSGFELFSRSAGCPWMNVLLIHCFNIYARTLYSEQRKNKILAVKVKLAR